MFDSLALIAFLLRSLLLCLPVYSIPLDLRQDNSSPQTVTTVSTLAYPIGGALIVSCVLVFTPVKDAEGKDAFREVKTCTLLLSSSGSPGASSTGVTSTSTNTVSIIPSSTTIPPAIYTSSPIPPPSSTSISTTSSPGPTAGSLPTNTGVPPTKPSPLPSTPTSSIFVQPSAAGVSAAADSSLPGKKMAVLPIGLGVFAGISVIVLIVVGLVTYERTKYRKAFQRRRLAEEAAPMGSGGMRL